MKKILSTGLSAIFLLTTITGCAIIPNKNWIDNRIKEGINQYKQEDRQWTKENYEEIIPEEQRLTAFNSVYHIFNQSYFKTEKGEIIEGNDYYTGSSIALNGGYFLTAQHVAKEEHPGTRHPFFKKARYAYSRFYFMDKTFFRAKKKYELEKILINNPSSQAKENKSLAYALLKVKDDVSLPCYYPGLNLPDKIELNMRSIAIGFPKELNRNSRSGEVSQLESDLGENCITFKNSLIPGDSGGPIFVVEDGNLKLVAIAESIDMIPDINPDIQVLHPTNINYGTKISKIIEDLELQLDSGKLDEKTTKEVKTFLELNVR